MCTLFSAEGAYLKSAIPSVLLQVDLVVLLDQSQLEESAFQQVSIITRRPVKLDLVAVLQTFNPRGWLTRERLHIVRYSSTLFFCTLTSSG